MIELLSSEYGDHWRSITTSDGDSGDSGGSALVSSPVCCRGGRSPGLQMAAIEKALNDFFNSGSLKAAVYRANAIFGFSSKVTAVNLCIRYSESI